MSTTQKPINPLFTLQSLVALLLPLIAETKAVCERAGVQLL